MRCKESNILILKPTAKFIPFIQAKIPDINWTELSNVQFHSTAYIIKNIETDDDLVDEVEKLYPLMFKSELTKLIGSKHAKKITGSFFDFLCCFKFELHANAFALKSSESHRSQVVSIQPKSVPLNIPNYNGTITLMDLCETISDACLGERKKVSVQNFSKMSEFVEFIRRNYNHIFNSDRTPDIDRPIANEFKMFKRYFNIAMHADTVHLS
ncbi:MAG: hypothetical protein P1U74_06595 [Legionellaceae bacterium]|nr:hypothetical protein [Legionellaceae bacterium]